MNTTSSPSSCWGTPFRTDLFVILILSLPFCAIAYPGYFEPWGEDSDLKIPPPASAITPSSIATRIADSIIRFHQEVISPIDGPRSHYRPTSSRYMQLAMHRYGFVKGFLMGCDRLIRENDEEWVYRTVEIDGRIFKYDPATENKYH
ncbi:MAG: membrane protein insertion efficiency factor YidD [Chlamydiia bacterium]|nr:membrane protein insertion efficiency factor YidD [Chlamydiia bacterium]